MARRSRLSSRISSATVADGAIIMGEETAISSYQPCRNKPGPVINASVRFFMQVLLVSTYDLGRQPFGLASPAAWLRAEGHQVTTVDLSREPLPIESVTAADWIAFHLPMHTATRMAVPRIQTARQLNPAARICCYGLYAPVNLEMLRTLGVTHVIGGEFERTLTDLISGRPANLLPVILDRLPFQVPDRTTLPVLREYAGLVSDAERKVVGYTEASRGCKHL